MRPVIVTLLLLMLAGCQQDFDSRYQETERRVKAMEAKLDAQMAKDAKREPGEVDKSEQ
jgi:hypothetical protein